MTAKGQHTYLNTSADVTMRFLGSPTLVRATAASTNGAFGLIEQWSIAPGFASPYHTHHREDEAFYVIEGELAIVCGGQWMKAGPGAFVFGPREIPHGFKVIGNTPARMLLLCSPGGFEGMVLELSEPLSAPPSAPDMAKLAQTAAAYGIDLHGPLPEEPAGFAEQPATGDLKSLNALWLQAFNDRNWALEAALRTPDFRAVLSGMPGPLDSPAWSGFLQGFVAAFPDSRMVTDSCVAEGDTVVTRWTITGTHQGDFQGVPPSGRPVKFSGIEYNRVVEGRITEHHAQFDIMSLLGQIGALPA